MRDNDTASCHVWRDLTQTFCDIFIGEAMKSVTADALRIQRFRDGISVSDFRVGSVKSGIETSDLRQIWVTLPSRADRRQIIGLMERGERSESLELVENDFVDESWFTIVQPSVYHTMPDGGRQCLADLGLEKLYDSVQRFAQAIDLGCGPSLINKYLSFGAGHTQSRTHAHAVDLPFQTSMKLTANRDREDLKLDA
jgi:hypothetical protein